KIAEILQANSRRKGGPFLKVNAGGLPEELLEAELFGAEAGAYTGSAKLRFGRFEAAHGGTLFLDEIANLSPAGQAKLLRVLQTGEFERLGNVRELQNRIQRACVVSRGGMIQPADLGLDEASAARNADSTAAEESIPDDRATLEAALERAQGVVSRAAAELGLSRQAFYRRMERHGIVMERRQRR